MSNIPTATIYNDNNNADALYVDGRLRAENLSIDDLVNVFSDKPFSLNKIKIDWFIGNWPDDESHLKTLVESSRD